MATFFALIWERQRAVRASMLPGTLILTALICYLYATFCSRGLSPVARTEIAKQLHFFFLWGQGVMRAGILLFCQPTDRRPAGAFAVPFHLRLLPLETYTLVAAELLFGIVAIALSVAISTIVVAVVNGIHLGYQAQLLFASTLYCTGLAATRLLPNTAGRLAALLAVAGLGTQWMELFYPKVWTSVGLNDYAAAALVTSCSFLLAWAGGAWGRSGYAWIQTRRLRPSFWDAIASRLLARRPSRLRPYRSALHAQFMYEFRKRWWRVAVLGFLAMLIASILIASGAVESQERAAAAMAFVCVVLPIGFFAVGFSMGSGCSRGGEREISSFRGALPLSPNMTAYAVLCAAFASLLLTWAAILCVGIILVPPSNFEIARLGEGANAATPLILVAYSIVVLCISWSMLSFSMCVRLTGRAWLSKSVAAGFFCLLLCGRFIVTAPGWVHVLASWAIPTVILFAVTGIVLMALKRKIVSVKAAFAVPLFGSAVLAFVATVARIALPGSFPTSVNALLFGFALAVVPAVPLVAAPLAIALDWYRQPTRLIESSSGDSS